MSTITSKSDSLNSSAFSDASDDNITEIFTKFRELPAEMQIKVWEHALPDPHQIESAIVMIINLDLTKPKAFLPSPIKLWKNQIYATTHGDEEEHPGLSDDDESSLYSGFIDREDILSLMQTCRAARTLVRETYLLEIASTIAGEDTHFWNDPDDILYFHFTQLSKFRHDTMLQYLTREGPGPRNLYGFDGIRHIAFRFEENTLWALDYPRNYRLDIGDHHNDGATWKLYIQENFPSLESLSLFIDISFEREEWEDGKLVLFPVDETIEIGSVEMTSDLFEELIQQKLSGSEVDWEHELKVPPIVDIYVVVRINKKKKKLQT